MHDPNKIINKISKKVQAITSGRLTKIGEVNDGYTVGIECVVGSDHAVQLEELNDIEKTLQQLMLEKDITDHQTMVHISHDLQHDDLYLLSHQTMFIGITED